MEKLSHTSRFLTTLITQLGTPAALREENERMGETETSRGLGHGSVAALDKDMRFIQF